MRLMGSCALLVFATTLGVFFGAAAAGDSRPTAAGDWEAVIEAPDRPWIFVVHLKPADGGWAGSMSVEGLGDFPLGDVRVEAGRVSFRLPAELDAIPFDGTLEKDTILGQVTEAGKATPTRLTRVAPLRAPDGRLEAWRQDIDYASAHLSEYDRSFTPQARDELRRSLARLSGDPGLAGKSDAEILVGLSRAVALAGNAHTRLRLAPTRGGTFATEFPLRIWSFSDGAYVIRAAAPYERALRCRVVAIDGHELSEVRARVAGLFAGNDGWEAYLTPIYLVSPDILFGLNLTRSAEAATFTLEDSRKQRFEVAVRAERIAEDAGPSESWQEISPMLPSGSPQWKTALAAREDLLPSYLRHPEKAYWFEFRPESGLLYFQFNRAGHDEQGPTFEQFGESLLTFVRGHPVRGVVVDLRFNSGGNLQVAKSFVRGLARERRINRKGRLFVITGHCTFSAGLYHAAQLKQFTKATFVGETVGDDLDYWAEGGRIVLPNSRAAIQYANGFHRYSRIDYPANRPYYETLSIATLAPDVPAPMSSADYFSGRDPALAAIEARLRK